MSGRGEVETLKRDVCSVLDVRSPGEAVRASPWSGPVHRRRVALGIAALVLALASLGWAQPAAAGSGPTLRGWTSDATYLSGATSVAVSGTHAYTTSYYAGRLTAIDISNPDSPVISGESGSDNNLLNASTITISGSYAYVVSKNRNGTVSSGSNDDGTGNSLTILDIATNPAQPAIVGSIRDSSKLFGAYGIAVSGHYAYIAAQGCLSGQPCPDPTVGDSFVVVDVGTPANPAIVATIRNSSLPAPWAGSNALKHATSVAVSGNDAYVTAAYSDRLTTIDISNPSNPTIVSSLRDPNAFAFPVDVAVQNGYAYVADQASAVGRVAVVDVSTPSNPAVVGSLTDTTWLDGAYRIRVRGDFAYVSAAYANAVTAVDISDPTNPRFAGGTASSAVLTRTTGLDLDSAGRYVVASSPHTSSQNTPLYPPYPLQQGGGTATGTASLIDLAPASLTVAIAASSKPPDPTTQTTANFSFSASNTVASYRCSLDGAPFTPCTGSGSQSYISLAVGPHTFTVEATDSTGNTATDGYGWTVSTGGGGPGVSTPVLDDFNRANGSAGPNWSTLMSFFAGLAITNNQAVSAANKYTWDAWATSYGPDSEAYATIAATAGTDTIRIGARVSGVGSNNYSGYFVSISPNGDWSIIRVDNGNAPVTLATGVNQPLSPGDKIAIQIAGAQITALHWTTANGWAQVLTDDTSSDTTRYTNPGNLAIEFKTSTIDNFGGGTLGGATSGAPVNTQLPSISGTTTVGQQLTATSGTWTGTPTPTYSYAWKRCDTHGANCTPISGAIGNAYTLTTTDAGNTITVAVTATNTAGTATATATPTTVIQQTGSAPVNTQLPSISGTTTVGQQLTATSGTWTGTPTPTYSYAWKRCDTNGANCTPISGAIGNAYTLTTTDAGNTITVAVTATNTAGTATATATPTTVIQQTGGGPGVSTPVLDDFNRANGSAGPNWSTLMSFFAGLAITNNQAVSAANKYTWDAWATSYGPDSEAYATIAATAGTDTIRIGARVSGVGSNNYSGYFVSISPNGDWSIIRVDNGNAPVTLATGVNQPLSPGDKIAIQIAGAQITALHWTTANGWAQVLTDDTSSDTTRYTNPGNLAIEFKTSTIDNFGGGTLGGATSGAPVNTQLPSISGTTTVGQQLTATSGTWTGTPTPTYSYAWKRCDTHGANCTPISGAIGNAYTLTTTDAGNTITVAVTATNTAGTATATATPTTVIQQTGSAPVNTQLPSISGTTTVGQQLTATSGTWTGTPTPTYSYAWKRCDTNGANCTPISGAIGNAYTLTTTDAGNTITVAVTATNTAGTATATATPTTVIQQTGGGPGVSTPVLDDFNRANGSAGPNWSTLMSFFAGLAITNNQAVSAANKYTWDAWATSYGPDSEAYATIAATAGTDTIRIGARVSGVGSNNYSGYFVSISPNGDWSIIRVDNGNAPVTLATGVNQPLSPGDKIAIQIAGAQITALHWTTANGWAQVLTDDTSSDTTRYTNPGNLAIEFKTSTIDNFGGGTLP